MVFRDTTTADVNFDVEAREKEAEERIKAAQGVANVVTDSVPFGFVEGVSGDVVGSPARRLGIFDEMGPLTQRMRDNPLMQDWEMYWRQKQIQDGKNEQWARSRGRSLRRIGLTSWASGMNPDLPATYKQLGVPANIGVKKKKLPSGEVVYGNATWQDSPVYKESPEFWDTYERWSKTPYEEVAAELRESLGPNAVIDEQAFRQKVNAYRQLVNTTKEVERLQQIAEYPEEGGFIRDFKAYVDEWDRLDKSGGFAGGVKNWIEDVKLMGEGTYQVLTTLAGIQELNQGQTDRQFGKELGEAFASGLAGGLTAAMQEDPETGEMRVSRKPLILLGTIAPTMWNLAKAARGGYLSKPVAQQVDLLAKQDSRFAKAFNATLNAVDKVKAGAAKVAEPVSGLVNKVAEIELPSYIRKDKEVGRSAVDMPDAKGRIKVDPQGPIDFDPNKIRPGSDRQLRTLGDVTRAAVKDLGLWSISGLPFYNAGAAAGLIAAQGLGRIGYGALLKASPKALAAHRKIRQYMTMSGKSGALDNIDERATDQKMRDFAEAIQGQFGEDLQTEIISFHKKRLAGDPIRIVGEGEIAGMDIPSEAREVVGRAYSEAVPRDQRDRVELGEFGSMVDARLVRERERPDVDVPVRTAQPGQAIKIGRPSRAPQELLDQRAASISRLQEINALLDAQDNRPPAPTPEGFPVTPDLSLGRFTEQDKRIADLGLAYEARQNRAKRFMADLRDDQGFRVRRAPDRSYPKLSMEDQIQLAIDRIEEFDKFVETTRAIQEAEAQPPSREVSAVDSPIADDAVARPEREATVVRLGDQVIEAVTPAEADRRAVETLIGFVRTAAEEARENMTPQTVRRYLQERGAPQSDFNVKNTNDHFLEAINLAEQAAIEDLRYRNNPPDSVTKNLEDNLNNLTVEFADETVASLLDQGVGASKRQSTASPLETATLFSQFKENFKQQAKNELEQGQTFEANTAKIMELLSAFKGRFLERDLSRAVKNLEESITDQGDLIVGGPLYRLAQGQEPVTGIRSRETTVRGPSGEPEAIRVAAGDQPTRQDLAGPQAQPRKPMAEVTRQERRVESAAAARPEKTKVNMLNEETGMWEDIDIEYPDLDVSNIKFNPKRLEQLRTEDGARQVLRASIEKELGQKPTSFLINSARSRGLLGREGGKQLRLDFIEEGDVRSVANVRKELIERITGDRLKEDTGRLSFVRKLANMSNEELNAFAEKQSPKIEFKKTKTRPTIRKKADKVNHILATLKRRRDKGIPEARQKLNNLIAKRNELEARIRQARRDPVTGFDLDDTPARSFEQVERGLDLAELNSVNEQIRFARRDLNAAEFRDQTIRTRDLERGPKQRVDDQTKLKKAREEVDKLTEQEVLEELFRYDPSTKETYRLKKTQRKGGKTKPDVIEREEGPEGETVKYGFTGVKDVPTARDALARFRASGAKPDVARYPFGSSTSKKKAESLLAKYQERLKKEQGASPEVPDDLVVFDPEFDKAIRKTAQAVPGKTPVAGMVRMLMKYLETKGGQAADFDVKRLNERLTELEKPKKGETAIQLEQFGERPKKQTKKPEAKKETKAKQEPKAKPKKDQEEIQFEKLEKRVNDMYDAVISETDLKKINRALVPIQSVYGQVARLQLPFSRKQKMLEKLRDISGRASDKRRSETFSAKFETMTDELTALAEGEIIPELMGVSRGTFATVQSAFTNSKTGIFAKLNRAVDELKANAEAATEKKQAEANRNYVNGLDDRVALLARALEELEEGSIASLSDISLGIRDEVATRFDRFDEYGQNMFEKRKAGKEVSSRMATAPSKGGVARSFGLARLDGNYFLDVNWYRSRSDTRYVKSPDGPELVPNQAIEAAIAAEIIFRDMQKSKDLISAELAKAQQINATVPGTREYFANQAAAIVTDPLAKMPEGANANFKREIYKLREKVNRNETIPIRKTVIEINQSDLSPAEKYALYRQINKMHQWQESHGPGVVKSTGETRFDAQERALMESPVVTNAAMIADSDGNMRPSKKMVVRLVRPWSKDFDQKMQRYVKKMERMGRSQMEQNAFIANVMEVFNQGNALLLDDSFRDLVSDRVAKNISDQIVAAYASDAAGKKRKGLSNTEMKKLRENVSEFLAEYALPFMGLPPAARYAKGSVNASRMLASMPTRFDYFSGETRIASADLIDIIQNTFDSIKSDESRLLVTLSAARNLSGRLQSQAKSSALVAVSNNEMDRFGINYTDSPLEALSKYIYRTVFRGEARPVSMVFMLAEEKGSTKVVYRTKEDILDSHSGNFDEFVGTIQEVYHQDLRKIFKDKYKEDYVKITPEVVDKVNRKHGTNYTSRLTKQQIEDAFGGLDSMSQSSPVASMIRDMEEQMFSMNNLGKPLNIKSFDSIIDSIDSFNTTKLKEEIQLNTPFTSKLYTELSDIGVTDAPSVVDSQIQISPSELSVDRVFDIPMSKGFLESIAWDAKLSRDMQSMMGKASSIMKAGLTVRSAITQLGNIVGNSLAIGMTTGEDMASLAVRIAKSEAIFYAHAQNPKGFLSAAQRAKLDKDSRKIVEAVESIGANTALDAMDSFNVEIGKAARRSLGRTAAPKTKAGEVATSIFDLTVAAPRKVMRAQDFLYKHGDAAPRRAEVLREYIEGRDLLDAMEPGAAMSFRVSRKGYTTFYKDNKGIYQLSREGKKTYSDLAKNGVNDFTSKVLAAYAVHKTQGRIFNYRNVPRAVEMIRSGGFGAAGSLFFSQFASFPYLAADFFGKKGLLASTVFEPFFDDSIITNSKRSILQKSYYQTLRGTRRGMMLTAFQSMRYPESEALQEDSKFRRTSNTMGAVLPARSDNPGFYRYFSWTNANGFETSIGLINYALGVQAWLASEADKAFGGKGDGLNEFGKTMLAQVVAKERGQTRELLDLMTFGGSILGSFLVDYNKDYGNNGSSIQRLLATAFGKDQSRFMNALLTTKDPASTTSVYRPVIQEMLAIDKKQFNDLSKEEQSQLIRDNFWPIVFNMRFKEKPIIEPRKVKTPTNQIRNQAISNFSKGLEQTLLEGIEEFIQDAEPRVFQTENLRPKVIRSTDKEEEKEREKLARYIRAELFDTQGGIVTALQKYYEAINTYDEKQKAYEAAVIKGEKKSDLAKRKKALQNLKANVKTTRKKQQSARVRAAKLAREVAAEKINIERRAKERAQ